MNGEELTILVRRRIESRYRRIAFVYGELARVDAEARRRAAGESAGARALYGGSFEDMVFATIDFSVYGKIDAGEFTLLFDEGLSDFDEGFYRKVFNRNREDVRQTISRAYFRAGPAYVCRRPGPLILSIMRSLHVSLEFAPLFTPADLGEDGDGSRCFALAAALDGVVIRHGDGMETNLFAPGPEKEAVLCGTFRPLGKAHTIVLVPKPGL